MSTDTIADVSAPTDLEELVEVKDDTYSPPKRRVRHHESYAFPSSDSHCDDFARMFSERLRELYPNRHFGERADEIFMAVNEQVINVNEHANHRDESRKINVRHYRVGNRAFVHIAGDAPQKDYPVGKWFEDKSCKSGVMPHKRGWGMELAKQYTSHIVVDRSGGLILAFELFPRIIVKKNIGWQRGDLEWTVRYDVVPDKEGYNAVVDKMDAMLPGKVPDGCYRRASIAMTEGLKNYCEHSQGWNPDGKVVMRLWKRSGGLYARISSDGKGFDPRSMVNTPELRGYGTAPDWFTNGRKGEFGMFSWGGMIMQGSADTVLYSPEGKILEMGFRLTD